MSNCAVSPRRRSGTTAINVLSSSKRICTFSKNIARISSVEYSNARKIIDAGSLRRLSIRTNKLSFGSNSKSNHEPR